MSEQRDRQREEEKFVAIQFCRLYEVSRACRCKVIQQCDPPKPDALIEVGGANVFLELAAYREQGPHNVAQELDEELKDLIAEAWRQDPEVKHFLVSLHYRKNGQRFCVPNRKSNRSVLIQELKVLVCRVGKPLSERVILVRFAPADKTEWYMRHTRGTQWTAGEEYPVLAKYCDSLWIRCRPKSSSNRPRSSLDARATGVDKKELQEVYTAKIGKLAAYRKEAEGNPVWLLLYSLVWPSSARVAPVLQDRLLKNLQSITEKAPGFDKVWWGNNIADGAGSIHPVV